MAFSVEKVCLSYLRHIYFTRVTSVCTIVMPIPDYPGTSLQGSKASRCRHRSPATKRTANSTKKCLIMLCCCFCLRRPGGRRVYLRKEPFLTLHTLWGFTTHPQKDSAGLAAAHKFSPPTPSHGWHTPALCTSPGRVQEQIKVTV